MNVKVKKKTKEERFDVIENKGITLIALVITIIVLLILAGVALATLTGENGILTQANKAKTETNNANIEEQVKLAFLGSYGTDGKLDYSELRKNLEEIEEMVGVPNTITEGSFPLTATVNREEIKIFEDGTIFNSGEWDKTATPEDCFIWESDTEGEKGYNTIIGYTSNITSYTKVRIPSRCQSIKGIGMNDPEDSSAGRSFFVGVEKIEIPNTVEEIGIYAFWAGLFGLEYSLKEIDIPSSVTSIGWMAFTNCKNLSSITIPSSVTSIEMFAFTGWISSQTINIQGYTNRPSGWHSDWNNACSATINWGQ